MKVYELINNKEFDFNVKFKVYRYIPACNKEGEMILVFDSETSHDITPDVCLQDITAINQAEDGTVEIEFV